MAGYHEREIPRGTLGEVSKIDEELAEYKDACEQGAKILVICELADLFGAIRAWAIKNDVEFPCDKHYAHERLLTAVARFKKELANREKEDMGQRVYSMEEILEHLVVDLAHAAAVYGMDLRDLNAMTLLTERAFKEGKR